MERGSGFDWQRLGKADYAQAHALVASLPASTRNQLDGTDTELTVRILHLAWRFSERSGRGAAYCWPTLQTLATYCQRSVRTVERHLSKLAELGVIEWRARMTSIGKRTSNLYQMGKTFMASLFARKGKKVQQVQTPTKLSDNNLKKGYKLAPTTGSHAYEPPEWMHERLAQQASSYRDAVAKAGREWEERVARDVDSAVEDSMGEWGERAEPTQEQQRRQALKRQAEQLKARGL